METRPVAVKNFLGYGLKRLGVDYIEIYSRIEAALPPTAVAGTRYDEHQMRGLER